MTIEEFKAVIIDLFIKKTITTMVDNFIESFKNVKSYEEFHDKVRIISAIDLQLVETKCMEEEEYMLVSYLKKELEYRSTLPKPKKDILNRRR